MRSQRIIRSACCIFFYVCATGILSGQPQQEGFVDAGGTRLYYRSVGSGPPIVVLHGGPGMDHTYFLPQLLRLAQYYRLIFYDQRSSGRSGGSVDSASMTIGRFVDDLESLRIGLKLGTVNLLGHSWGGRLAMQYAITHPENVASLLLVSSAGASGDFLEPFGATRAERTTHNDSLAMMRVVTSPEFARSDSTAVSKLARIIFSTYFFDRTYVDSLNLAFSQHTATNFLPINASLGTSMRTDLRAKISAIACPTLILHGDHDPIPIRFAEEIHRLIGGSDFILLKDCGHFPFIERPKDFLDACLTFYRGVFQEPLRR